MGLSDTRIGDPDRRDRMLLISAIAISLLTILGAAGEAIGHDKWLNDVAVRQSTSVVDGQAMERVCARPRPSNYPRYPHRERRPPPGSA